jgi:Asp-tRNA(Asn)/Glu-tRNA(Gln) amidotransferase A subunit family amidase
MSLHQPAPTLRGWDTVNLAELRLGVYWPWFRHATPDVVTVCEAMLESFQERGSTIVDVTIPDLEPARVAHVISIGSEMGQALDRYDAAHRRDWGLDVRTNMALIREFSARDLVQAQRVRTRMMANVNRVLEHVDVILTPAAALPAPPVPEAALSHGESDLTTLTEVMRFAPLANMTGHPAISFPAGYNDAGLPIGLQAIGRAWEEPTLLRLALAAEGIVERKRPQLHYSILED